MKLLILLSFGLHAWAQSPSVDYPLQVKRKAAEDPRRFQFTRTNGSGASGDLSASGAGKTITLTPCPTGIAGSDTAHYVYISGGTGTAEAVLITGGTCTSAAATGTLIVTTAQTHTGAWTVTSASGGIHEAVCSLPSAGGLVAAANGTATTLYANVTTCGKTSVSVFKPSGATITGSFLVVETDMSATGEIQADSGPTSWAGLVWPNVHDAFRKVIGNLPQSVQHQAGLVNTATYGLDIPATANYSGHASSVVGMVRSKSTTTGGVGVLGFAIPGTGAGTGTLLWGSNFICDNLGIAITTCQAAEFNVNNSASSAVNVLGANFVGGASVQPSGNANAVHIQPLGVFVSPKIKWKRALYTLAGAVDEVAIELNPTAETASSQSQGLRFVARNAGLALKLADLYVDSTGAMITHVPAGQSFGIGDSVGGYTITGSNAAFNVHKPLVLDDRITVDHVLIGSLGTASTGVVVYCTTCAAGTNPCTVGTGAWAFANGVSWNCPF